MPPRSKKGSGVSVTIPEKSAGRTLDALTDIIRPFSEARGLKAEQIRLQREEVLIEIAKKAKERLAIEKQPIRPIPNKILVPLLEAASNEDIDDTYMVDMWAKLLASAASGAKVEPRYVGILKELSGRHAQVLQTLAANSSGESEYARELATTPSALDPTVTLTVLENLLMHATEGDNAPAMRVIQSRAMNILNRRGSLVMLISVYCDGHRPMVSSSNLFKDGYREVDLEILASAGLCRRIHECIRVNRVELHIDYYYIAYLGIDFLRCCSPELFDNTEAIVNKEPL